MSRSNFGTTVRELARAAARAERAQQQAQIRQQAAAIRELRNADRQAKADKKEAARLYVASRTEEADDLTKAVQQREAAIERVLVEALGKNPAVPLGSTLRSFVDGHFEESQWVSVQPRIEDYLPHKPGFWASLVPGAAGRHGRRVADAKRRYQTADCVHKQRCQARETAYASFVADEAIKRADVDQHNKAVADMQPGLKACEHSSLIGYYKLVLDQSLQGEPDAISAEIGYSPESKHLVVDLELPEISTIPAETAFRYVRSVDSIEAIERPLAKRRAIYGLLLSNITLKCVDTIFRGGPGGTVECLTVNGMLETIDPATGQQVRICLISVRVTADVFRSLNLAQVHPEHCLRSLRASVSRAPAELLPVKPLIELDMVDPRFVETVDVMSGLDQRPNLMELTPSEFESLITNLFGSMGLDTRQTRPSRDGGVDCVAFDPRPVFGGRVVIQAKRYKNTVGVSAVRDLFGTVQNEGASKGILVTTSGYGKSSYEFARGKPLELLDGGNLLHLLSEHAGVEARILMPDGWADLPVHGE